MTASRKRMVVKRGLFVEQGGRCHWCERPVRLEITGTPLPDDIGTLDHVYAKGDPRRDNHALRPHNAIAEILACHACNNERGNMLYDDFLKLKRVEWRTA